MDKIAMTIYVAWCLLLGWLSAPYSGALIWISKGIGIGLLGAIAFLWLTFTFERSKY